MGVTFDVVEIGTSDFDTEVSKFPDTSAARILSVEPNPAFLESLPDKPNSSKLGVAISDEPRETTLHYLDKNTRVKLGLNKW